MDIVSTRCEVKITTPEGYKISFSSLQPQGDLISVETNKDIGDACGGFNLEFAPRVVDGKTWDERIPMRSLVEIRMERPGDAGKLPQVNATVMIGLTDDHARAEGYQQVNPTRTVTISGREISAVLLDAALFFHPMLIKSSGEGIGGGIQGPRENIFGLGALGVALAWQPNLLKDGLDPRENLAVILEHFIFGGGTTTSSNAPASPEESQGEVSSSITDPETGEVISLEPTKTQPATAISQTSANGTGPPARSEPVINLYLPDRPLNQILILNKEAWTTFQPVEVSIGQNSAFMNSVYNYCQICVDPAFQEFFTRIEDGVSKIHFRGKPFKQEKVTVGSRFDEAAKTCHTLVLDPAWIMSVNLRRNSQAVYNIFWVTPMGTLNLLDATSMGYLAKPAVIIDPKHPSSLIRYGIRLMKVASPYLPAWGPGMAASGSGTGKGGAGIPAQQLSGAPTGPLPTSARIPTERLKANQVEIADMAARVAREEGVPEPMIPSFLANMQVESNFNPRAVSKVGAQGLGQLMPKTAEGLGVKNPFDPVDNARGSARYWRQLTKQFGQNPTLVAAAYNAGPGNVKKYGGIPPFAETQNHVVKVNTLARTFASNGTPTATLTTPPPAPPVTTEPPAAAPKEKPPPPTSGITALAEFWSSILEAWYDHGGQLVVGSVLVRGHPAWNIGHRLVLSDTRGEREFYVEGVAHRYDMRTGLYTTALRVTRGWYLDGKTDEREASKDIAVVPERIVPGAGTPPPIEPPEPQSVPNPLLSPWKITIR